MRKTLTEEIMELRQMKLPELLTRYEALFGKPPRTKHREWLWKRISWKVQERNVSTTLRHHDIEFSVAPLASN